MSSVDMINIILEDLKRRYALCTLTYAEAVMIEDLIAIIPHVDSPSENNPAKCVAETLLDRF